MEASAHAEEPVILNAMGFCDRSSNDLALVLPTYLLALLPWSMIPLLNPFTPEWKPYWLVRLRTGTYLAVSILPYGLLVPYAILQSCSKEQDIKELLTSVVAMVASLYNLSRAIRAVLALYDVHTVWADVDIVTIRYAFRHLMPEERSGEEAHLRYDIDKRHKCSVLNVLVSSALVDSDGSGIAPRVPYITVFCFALYEVVLNKLRQKRAGDTLSKLFSTTVIKKVPPGQLQARRSMIAIWILWMVRRTVAISQKNSCVRETLKYPWARRKRERVSIENQYFGDGNVSARREEKLWRSWSKPCFTKKTLATGDIVYESSSDTISQLEFNRVVIDSGLSRAIVLWKVGLKHRQEESYERVESRILYYAEYPTHIENESRREVASGELSAKEPDHVRGSADRSPPQIIALRSSEIERQMDSLPPMPKHDLNLAKLYQIPKEKGWWSHYIAEFELYLSVMEETHENLEHKLCNALKLPKEPYASVLREWIESFNHPENPGLLLAPLILLLSDKARTNIRFVDYMSSLIGETRTWKNFFLRYPRSESAKRMTDIGLIMSSTKKYSKVEDVIKAFNELSRPREEAVLRDMSSFLKEVIGEDWIGNVQACKTILEALNSLHIRLRTMDMPKFRGDDFSPSVVYNFLPSYAYFSYNQGREDGSEGVAENKAIAIKQAEEMLLAEPENWEKVGKGDMTFKAAWGWLGVTASFENVTKGLYAATASFLSPDAWKDEQDCPSLSSYIELEISIRSRSVGGSAYYCWFQTEPVFLFRYEVDPAGGWMHLKFCNIKVDNEDSEIVIKVRGQYRPVERGKTITLGPFALFTMEDDKDNVLPPYTHCAVRKARQTSCVVNLSS